MQEEEGSVLMASPRTSATAYEPSLPEIAGWADELEALHARIAPKVC